MTSAIEKYLTGVKSNELLLPLTWDEWLAIAPPYTDGKFSSSEVTARYQRNGYDWDMHGTLYTPEKETDGRRALVFFHGGAGSEKIMDLTPAAAPAWPGWPRLKASKFSLSPIPATTRPAAFGKCRFRSASQFTCSTASSAQKRSPTAI